MEPTVLLKLSNPVIKMISVINNQDEAYSDECKWKEFG